MPPIKTIRLPSFLPIPGEKMQELLPANHDSLSSMLGLCLAYLKHMHPAKPSRGEENAAASAHIISLFLHDPLILALLPQSSTQPTGPAKELTALQIHLTSLENTLTNLAKATADTRKDIQKHATPPQKTAQAHALPAQPATPHPSYTAKAASPQCPSTVMNVADYTWPNNMRLNPSDICATINLSLDHSGSTQVRISAAKWTAKGNLVLWSGPNTSAPQLTNALPL